jgi:hypothetical protein
MKLTRSNMKSIYILTLVKIEFGYKNSGTMCRKLMKTKINLEHYVNVIVDFWPRIVFMLLYKGRGGFLFFPNLTNNNLFKSLKGEIKFFFNTSFNLWFEQGIPLECVLQTESKYMGFIYQNLETWSYFFCLKRGV